MRVPRIETDDVADGVIRRDINSQRRTADDPRYTLQAGRRGERTSVSEQFMLVFEICMQIKRVNILEHAIAGKVSLQPGKIERVRRRCVTKRRDLGYVAEDGAEKAVELRADVDEEADD